MTAPGLQPVPVEEAWERLLASVRAEPGFWFGLIFTDDPRPALELRERTKAVLRAEARSLQVIAPSAPDELVHAVKSLIRAPHRTVWISAPHLDPPGTSHWRDAWTKSVQMLNLQRDRLVRELPGGLVLVAPYWLSSEGPATAPDLWSFRSMSLYLQSRQIEHATPAAKVLSSADADGDADADGLIWILDEPDLQVWDEVATERIGRGWQLAAGGRSLEAARIGQEVYGTTDDPAARSAAAVLVALSTDEPDLAQLFAGRIAEAAVPVGSDRGSDILRLLLNDPARALAAATALESLDDMDSGTEGDLPTLRRLSRVLDAAGEARFRLVDLAGAASSFDRALALDRRIVEVFGETPESLRDVSVALNRVGDVARASGELSRAGASYDESLGIRRRIVEVFGETPESLRDLAIALARVGDVARVSGDASLGRPAYVESLGICRRILDQWPGHSDVEEMVERLEARAQNTAG